MSRRRLTLISMLLLLTLSVSLFAGCGGQKATITDTKTKVTQNKTPGEPQVNKEKVFQAAGFWEKPPAFNGNYFNSDGVGISYCTSFQRLFYFVRASDKFYYELAESAENTEDKTIVKLKKNVKWHDGEPFTSKDIWAYYTLNNKIGICKLLSSVEIPDDYTVVFNWNKPVMSEPIRMYYISSSRQGTIAYHLYKEYVDKADEILKKAPALASGEKGPFGHKITEAIQKELNDNWSKFINAGPALPIGTGPFKVEKVDDNQMILVKFKDYYEADKIHFETLRLIRPGSDIAQDYAMLRNGDYDQAGDTPPKDVLESILAANTDLVHYKMYDPACLGIMFDERRKPFDDLKFRQALTYAIDKTKVREVGNYYGKEDPKISSLGVPTNVVKDYLLPDTKLTDYTYNTDKAAQLLTESGWKKGNDNVWVDKNGKKYEFIIASTASWDVAINCGQVIAEQLTKFGFPTKVKVVDDSVYVENCKKGDYDMSLDWVDITWSMNNPWHSLKNYYLGDLYERMGLPEEVKAAGRDGKIINVKEAIEKLPYITDEAEFKKIVNDLMYITNENAYAVNLYQNVTGTWLNLKNIDGILPMEDEFEKYNRNMPLPEDKETMDRIIETNQGFNSIRLLDSGEYWPR